jgi:hypothetical protein
MAVTESSQLLPKVVCERGVSTSVAGSDEDNHGREFLLTSEVKIPSFRKRDSHPPALIMLSSSFPEARGIGRLGSIAVAVNSLAGPAILQLPFQYQQSVRDTKQRQLYGALIEDPTHLTTWSKQSNNTHRGSSPPRSV